MIKHIIVLLVLFFSIMVNAQDEVNEGDNGVIAFISDQDGGTDIYLMSPDDGSVIRLTPDHGIQFRYAPIWSPDGSQLAVFAGQGPSAIYRVDAQTGEMTLLIDEIASRGRLSWSPDGEWIAFDSSHENNNDSIFRIRVDGSDLESLTDTENASGHESFPAWSPDGEWVAFVAGGDIWKVNPESGELVQLTADEYDMAERFPVWSPDGERLAFIGEASADNYDIYIMLADGSDKQQVTVSEANEGKPAWSPDGERLALLCGTDVCVVNADGSGYAQVTTGAQTNDPSWSPDGEWIVFLALANEQSDIFRVRPDGNDGQNLTSNEAGENAPQWFWPAK